MQGRAIIAAGLHPPGGVAQRSQDLEEVLLHSTEGDAHAADARFRVADGVADRVAGVGVTGGSGGRRRGVGLAIRNSRCLQVDPLAAHV
ncbi:hypothetical protein GUJ93_ZPchr0001g32951 [Zizania palustris]|uniref:Uncharacterized protein n=1 Tax=Zizania palustris TaxID=103762 RepID=A0A8J5RV11_ZIZPA|nr:hypothetical protein GUJ93_ZPchr0001g32951 [Zizania palustris]